MPSWEGAIGCLQTLQCGWRRASEATYSQSRMTASGAVFDGGRETRRCAVGVEHRIRMAASHHAIAVGIVIGCAATLQHRCGLDGGEAGDPWYRLAVAVIAGIAKDVAVLAVNEDETLTLVHTLLPLRHFRLFVLNFRR